MAWEAYNISEASVREARLCPPAPSGSRGEPEEMSGKVPLWTCELA